MAQLSITVKKLSKNSNEALEIWELIREKAAECIKSIIFKVEAVNMVAESRGAVTAGCDNLAFIFMPKKPVNRAQALVYFKEEIKRLKRDLSLKDGKTDQVYNRKGKLTKDRELMRR